MAHSRHHRWQRGVLWLCFFLSLPLGAPTAVAGEYDKVAATCQAAEGDSVAEASILVASWWQGAFGSRTRIIQVTTLAVILGIFILQWRRT